MYATYSQGFRKEIIIQTDSQMLYLYMIDLYLNICIYIYIEKVERIKPIW